MKKKEDFWYIVLKRVYFLTPGYLKYAVKKETKGKVHRLNTRLNMFPAMLRANPPVSMAREAMLDAWENLSAREKARVLVIVRMSAITMGRGLLALVP